MHILVVDDEPFISEVLAMVLKNAGHTVKTESDGALALSTIEHGSFDLVITDLSMPMMDGLTLAKEIKARNASQTVILLTGFIVASTLPANVDYILAKPVDVEKLLQLLASLGKPGIL